MAYKYPYGFIALLHVCAFIFTSYSQEYNKIHNLLKNIDTLSWDIPIDSALGYLSQFGFDSCRTVDRYNRVTIGPCVVCEGDSVNLSSIYRWKSTKWRSPDIKDYKAIQSFYSISFKNCSECTRFYHSLEKLGFHTAEFTDPIELKMVVKPFVNTAGKKYEFQIENHCKNRTRLRIYRVKKQ